MSFFVIIPARYGSSRLPGKPLLDLAGKPMVQRVYERACQSGAEAVYVATDHEQVAEAVAAFGGQAIMTSADCTSGTERLSEAVRRIGLDDQSIIVNLQGDEPMMSAPCIRQVAQAIMQNTDANVATLCETIHQYDDIFNPNIVKVVRDTQQFALYFSRAPIPWSREYFSETGKSWPLSEGKHYMRHIGLYAYRAGFIHDYVCSEACDLENIECLEQLRVLYHGGRIMVAEANGETGIGVDTRQDLERVREMIARQGEK